MKGEDKRQLSLTFGKQGRHEEAKELLHECNRISSRHLGLEHPDTIDLISDSGGTLCREGDYTTGLEFHKLAVSLSIRVLGQDSRHTSHSESRFLEALSPDKQKRAFIEKEMGEIAMNDESRDDEGRINQ